jgi:hypothetical protein
MEVSIKTHAVKPRITLRYHVPMVDSEVQASHEEEACPVKSMR